MKLYVLLKGVEVLRFCADENTEIADVENDSRLVSEGSLFVAERGYKVDGNQFIPAAMAAGAAAVVCERIPEGDIPYVLVRDARKACSLISANFFGNPGNELTLIGVTGTNGKTTVTNLVKQLLESLTGERVGLIGTNRNMIGDTELETERTTPDSRQLQELFRRMADGGCRYCVMEVSSHALAMDRVYGIRFQVAVFTNLTEDHLDFHGTMEAYAEAKSTLFANAQRSVINIDDPYSGVMLSSCSGQAITVTAEGEADYSARNIQLREREVRFDLHTGEGDYGAVLGIPGKFSVYNALSAIGAVAALGLPIAEAVKALASCSGVKGRAEVVPTGKNFTVLIDYAHSPDALENILRTVRTFTKGKLHLVFGCGGDREHEKRPIMGEIACRLADIVYVTSDNPRTEDPDKIIDEIIAGIPEDTTAKWTAVTSRREAIGLAINGARQGDVVLLAGKGHETYQIVGAEKRPFDERKIVAQVLGDTKKCQKANGM